MKKNELIELVSSSLEIELTDERESIISILIDFAAEYAYQSIYEEISDTLSYKYKNNTKGGISDKCYL